MMTRASSMDSWSPPLSANQVFRLCRATETDDAENGRRIVIGARTKLLATASSLVLDFSGRREDALWLSPQTSALVVCVSVPHVQARRPVEMVQRPPGIVCDDR